MTISPENRFSKMLENPIHGVSDLFAESENKEKTKERRMKRKGGCRWRKRGREKKRAFKQ